MKSLLLLSFLFLQLTLTTPSFITSTKTIDGVIVKILRNTDTNEQLNVMTFGGKIDSLQLLRSSDKSGMRSEASRERRAKRR